MNCSICKKILNKNDVLYRLCDDYVCGKICSNERLNLISKVDPYLNNPISWSTTNDGHRHGLKLSSVSFQKIPINTTFIKIQPYKEFPSQSSYDKIKTSFNSSNKQPIISNNNAGKLKILNYIYKDFFLNSSLAIIFGFYFKSLINSLFKRNNSI